MQNLSAGLLAGFVATAALSVVLVMKSSMGVMPEMDVIQMLAGMMGGSVAVAWAAHFMIGTLAWGGGYALLYRQIPGNGAVAKGLMLGLVAWGMMMVAVMPMAGGRFFGMGFGMAAPVMTLMLHLMFGAVLGLVYQSRAVPAFA